MTRSELSKAEGEMFSRTSGTDSFGRTRRLKSVDLQIYPQVVLVDKMFLRVFFVSLVVTIHKQVETPF